MMRILIADDEMLERAVLKKTLQKNLGDRCEILQAENGREVLEIYMEKKPQVLILDIEMPGITGLEAAMRIREVDKECGIIFLTAFDEFSYAKKAITVRALDYLLKPFDEQELLLVTEEAVYKAEQRKKTTTNPQESVYLSGVERSAGVDCDFKLASGIKVARNSERDLEPVKQGKMAEMIRSYIIGHYSQDISMQDAAREMNYSEAYFSKLFKQCFGKNFTAYLTEYRIEEAKRLLEGPTVNIKKVGRAVGYGDANYFAKVFKRITGMTPSEYRHSVTT